MGWIRLVLVTLVLGSGAQAQEVREGDLNGLGIARKQYLRAAEKQGRADWPDPIEGSPGTQARLTFDSNNADLTLLTAKDFGLERLLTEGKRIAAALDLPQTNFITLNGNSSVGVDLEFNDYLRREGFRRHFEIDLHRLRSGLEASSLPKPVVLVIDPDDATTVRLTNPSSIRVIKEKTFLGLSEMAPGMKLRYEAEVTFGGVALGACFGLFLLFPLSLFLRLGKKEEPKPHPSIVEPASTEEVQKRYDRAPPMWILSSGFLLIPVLIIAARGLMKEAMISWSILLPFDVTWLMMGACGLMVVGSLGGTFFRRLAGRKAPAEGRLESEPPEQKEEQDPAVRGFSRMATVMMLGMLVMSGVLLWPVRTPEMMFWRSRLGIGLAILFGLAMVVVSFRNFRAGREKLEDGEWHRMVQDLAGICDVTVKHVVLVKSKTPNAFASIWGTVGLTSGLIEKLDPEEIRAVVAHELAHLKLRHPLRTFALSLLTTLAFLGLLWWVDASFGARLPLEVRALLRGPILFLFLLPLLKMLFIGRGMRGREHEADRLAADWIGDPELLIRALEKMHYHAETPGRLKPADEALATHPSLVRRIEQLRSSTSGLHKP